MMLVGRPGLGKTPPLGFIYKPINEYDDRLHENMNWNVTNMKEPCLSASTGMTGKAVAQNRIL